jgi:hypothetical protein
LCQEEVYLLNSAYFLIPPAHLDSKYLLSVLNSSAMQFYLNAIAETSGMGTTRWINANVKRFPIPIGRIEIVSKLVELVSAILRYTSDVDYLSKSDYQGYVRELEHRIDREVYALFDLSEVDIAIIEGQQLSANAMIPTASQTVAESRESEAQGVNPPFFTGTAPQGDLSTRKASVERLAKDGSPQAVQDLAAALADENDTIRWLAGMHLKRLGGQSVAGIVRAFLEQTDNPTARAEAQRVLDSLA